MGTASMVWLAIGEDRLALRAALVVVAVASVAVAVRLTVRLVQNRNQVRAFQRALHQPTTYLGPAPRGEDGEGRDGGSGTS